MISLPIDPAIPGILEEFETHQNLILMASAGSGKTTRLPAALLKQTSKKIVVLVPKRIAAVSAADRIAEENNWRLGDIIGYHVRFDPVFNSNTRLLFMTEGVFIKRAQDSNFWEEIDILIFDEFHERSSMIDMALGLAVERQILEGKLKLIVMSATLNAESLEKYLPESVTVEIKAPPYPLKINYSPKPQRLVCDQDFFTNLVQVTASCWNENQKDILIFLPGYSEIRRAETALTKKFASVPIDILHGSVKLSEQKHILQPQTQRRIVLATDIAESSLTLPSIDAVIDSGLKKVATQDAKLGFTQLSTQRISIFSATQRAGRAARVGPGSCYRLWHESDELSMPKQIKPEILRSDLTREILTLKACGIDDILNFTWLDAPHAKNIQVALDRLQLWGLLDQERRITSLGIQIQKLPLDIAHGILFYKLSEAGFQQDASQFIAALESLELSKVFAEKTFLGESDLDRLMTSPLTAQGEKIKNQLGARSLGFNEPQFDFRRILLTICFRYFPHMIAKKKSETEGVSSLGRGLSLLEGLNSRFSDYYIVLAGYNINDSKTEIYFAVGLTKNEFLEFSSTQVQEQTHYELNLERKQIYKTLTKKVGFFLVSESSKTPLSFSEQEAKWSDIIHENIDSLLQAHPAYQWFLERIRFLQKKKKDLSLPDDHFDFISTLPLDLVEDIVSSTRTVEQFLSYPLQALIDIHLPADIRRFLQALPEHYIVPSGKKIRVNYESENAPVLSVKIQDVFGWTDSPKLLDGRVPLTMELLAPNMRPTQITQNLNLFWQNSYFEIRKELKARYPRHPWPDDPAHFKFEKKK